MAQERHGKADENGRNQGDDQSDRIEQLRPLRGRHSDEEIGRQRIEQYQAVEHRGVIAGEVVMPPGQIAQQKGEHHRQKRANDGREHGAASQFQAMSPHAGENVRSRSLPNPWWMQSV